MDYNAAVAAQSAPNTLKPTPELGRLKAVAQRLSVAGDNLTYFLARFHGPQPESANRSQGEASDSYRNDIESVFMALERIENLVGALDHIG